MNKIFKESKFEVGDIVIHNNVFDTIRFIIIDTEVCPNSYSIKSITDGNIEISFDVWEWEIELCSYYRRTKIIEDLLND